MTIKCVAVDADHTLYSLHTKKAYDKKFDFLSNRTGIASNKIRRTWLDIVEKARHYQDYETRSREHSTKKALISLGLPDTERLDALVEDALNVFWENIKIETNQLARETIDALKSRGLQVVVVSDEYNKNLLGKLQRAGIVGYDYTIGPEETKELKPSPKFYDHLLKKTKLQPDEIVMIGDSWERDLRPAKALGLQTVLYRKREGNPDFFIDSLGEIVDIVDGKIILPEFFKSYDVRGKNPPLDGIAAERIGRVIGSFIPGKLNIVVGRDNKASSEMLENKLVQGLVSAGAKVTRVGIGPTDYTAFCISELKSDFGIMVTASHLPPEYNGFKFLYGAGNGFKNEDLAELKRKYLKEDVRRGIGEERSLELQTAYLDHAENVFRKHFKGIDATVLVDAGKGTGGNLACELLGRLGAKVIPVDKERPFDTSKQENMAYLPGELKRNNADLAVAFDLDADRIAVFDKQDWINGDELFCLADQELVGAGTPVIASIDTSTMLEDSSKGRVIHTRIGDPFVVSEALKRNAVLAGEPNGHYCIPEFVAYNSGVFFSAIYASLAKELQERRNALPKYFVERKECSADKPRVRVHRMVREIIKEYEVLSLIDGVKFKAGEATALIRASGTSNNIRLAVESKDGLLTKKTSEELSKKFF
ncbi:HAD-IA family hydrolase [archaeon]|nr:HAD-IA family hydrolase [archaeon]